VTESAIVGMLRYILEHADGNFPQKSNVMNKVCAFPQINSYKLIAKAF